MNMSGRNVLMWFNITDLRLHDNYALTLASKRCLATGGKVFPVFCFDVRTFATASRVAGFFRCHPRRARFLIGCVEDLRKNLATKHKGCPLWVRVGHPEIEVTKLAKQLACDEVYCHELYSPHEAGVQRATQKVLNANGQSLRAVWGSTLLHIDDLPPLPQITPEFQRFFDLYETTRIRPTAPYDCRKPHSVPVPTIEEHYPPEIDPGPMPLIRDLGYKDPLHRYDHTDDSRQVIVWTPGETAGCGVFQDFLESKEGMRYVTRYASNRPQPQLFGHSRATRISAWVTHGCISVRRMHELIRKYSLEREGTHDPQCRELITRLVWRDYWHYMGKKYGNQMYRIEGPTPDCTFWEPPDVWRHDVPIIRRFCAGKTGVPFIDACARELRTTGYNSVQAREALQWYLSRGLQQDWRIGAEWMQRNLIDYDPHLCWGGAAYATGLLFDMGRRSPQSSEKITMHADTSGMFTRLWVPELHNVPTYFLHRVQAMTPRMQRLHGAVLGVDYPHPIKLWIGAENDANLLGQLKSYVDEGSIPEVGEGYTHGLGVLKNEPKAPLLTA